MSEEKLITERLNVAGRGSKRPVSQVIRIFAALVWPLHLCFPAETGLNGFPKERDMVKHFWIFAGLAVSLLVLAGVSRAADRDSLGATGVTLYEISERVTFDPDPSSAGVIRRNATSPLQGFAEVGTPLCPSELLISVPRIQSCTVIATGTDTVSTVTGLGPVSGTFDVVINAPGNSSVHVPDLPVISGTFSGNVDLSLAVLHHVPLGSIAGSFNITQMADPTTGMLGPLPQPVVLPFKGTFRMPFAIDAHARHVRSDRKHAAFYLADDLRTLMLVRPTELSVGFPTVRLEVTFGP
jgi:hypothetical protein